MDSRKIERMNDELKDIVEILYRRYAVSKGHENLGQSKLPEYNIILKDDNPIYKRLVTLLCLLPVR